MGYYAWLRMEEKDGEDIYKVKGEAEKVIAKGFNYLNNKGNPKAVFKKFAEYISNDFAELNESLRMAGDKLLGKK